MWQAVTKQMPRQTFIKRLTKNQKAILTFLHHPKPPPDNNGSERAIRNIKVKVKVSGQYRSLRGVQNDLLSFAPL